MQSNLPVLMEIAECDKTAWRLFEQWHFVKRHPIAVYKTFIVPPNIAIIVYVWPALSHRSRRLATNGLFNKGSRTEIAHCVNANIKNIARVVVHPKYRKHRIASRLIRGTLSLVDSAYVECSTNLFGGSKCFQNAGMTRYMPSVPEMWFRIKALYKQIGFENIQNLNFRHQRVFFDHLTAAHEKIFRKNSKIYLNAKHVYKESDSNFELHRKIISRFDQVPMYYNWFNPEKSLKISLQQSG